MMVAGRRGRGAADIHSGCIRVGDGRRRVKRSVHCIILTGDRCFNGFSGHRNSTFINVDMDILIHHSCNKNRLISSIVALTNRGVHRSGLGVCPDHDMSNCAA